LEEDPNEVPPEALWTVLKIGVDPDGPVLGGVRSTVSCRIQAASAPRRWRPLDIRCKYWRLLVEPRAVSQRPAGRPSFQRYWFDLPELFFRFPRHPFSQEDMRRVAACREILRYVHFVCTILGTQTIVFEVMKVVSSRSYLFLA
jgi:hypothetical protein